MSIPHRATTTTRRTATAIPAEEDAADPRDSPAKRRPADSQRAEPEATGRRGAINTVAASPVDDPADACPPPLPWQQVLTNVRTQAETWTLGHDAGAITGRTIGEGPPLYFLNGISGTHELFALLVWLLREEFRCVLFDYPDAMGSAKDPAASIEGVLASTLFAVADRHGDRRFSICANSFGSLMALSAMRQQPHRVERTVLQTGFARRRLSGFERALIAVGRHLSGNLRSVPFREQIQRHNHRHWFPLFDESRFGLFVENTGAVSIAAVANRAAIVQRCDLRPRLADIRQPILLVRCEGEGRVASDCRQELAAGLPNARVERLHSCGQLPYLTHPHQLAKLVRSFLTGDLAAAESSGDQQQKS